MNKLLIVLVAVTAGVVVWALLPAPEPAPESVATATPAAPAGGPEAPAAGSKSTAEGDEPARRAPPGARPAQPGAMGDPTPPPPKVVLPRPDLKPPLQALPEGRIPDPGTERVGRDPGSMMPEVSVAEVKAGIRRYYGNLPRSGRMPARIELEELLPAAAIAALGVSPRSQVVEIGHYPATGVDGLVEALELPDDAQSTMGITVVTPEGHRVRDYIQVMPPE